MSQPLVSIALLTLDGGATLGALLESVAGQETDFRFEIVAVDSGSTDGSLDLLSERVERLERIPRGEFNHGTTRNRALELARGELVVLLVQDAVPADAHWLRELVAPLRAEPSIAGSYARQLARPGASALTRHALERWVAGGTEPAVTEPLGADEFDRLEPLARMARSTIDNVCSCVRRSVWQATRFAPTPIAEDLEWGRDVVRAGYRLAFTPAAAVVHSHERSLRYELGRTYLLHRRLYELFGVRLIPRRRDLARSFRATLPLHFRCALADRRRPGVALRTLALAAVWPLAQYLGGKAGATGRALLAPSGI